MRKIHDAAGIGDCSDGTRRRPSILPKWYPVPVQQIQRWLVQLREGGSTLLTVVGPDVEFRSSAYKICYDVVGVQALGSSRTTDDWLTKGVANDLTERVRAMTGRPWGLIWDLFSVQDFVVDEPLRGLIDQGARFTGLFRALWEVRFLLQERRQQEGHALLGAVLRWLYAQALSLEQQKLLAGVRIEHALTSLPERLDMLLFLLALTRQNGLADCTVFVIEGLDSVVRPNMLARRDLLRQLNETAAVFARWAQLGSATGLVLGMHDSTLQDIYRYSPSFGKKIAASLV